MKTKSPFFICSRKNGQVLKVLFLLLVLLSETVKYTLKATLKRPALLCGAGFGGTCTNSHVPESGPSLGTVSPRVTRKALPGLERLVPTCRGLSLVCRAGGVSRRLDSVSLTLTSTVLCLQRCGLKWLLQVQTWPSSVPALQEVQSSRSLSCVLRLFKVRLIRLWL